MFILFVFLGTISNSGMSLALGMELALGILAPVPYADQFEFQMPTAVHVDITYNLNELLAITSTFRVYLLIRFLLTISYFTSGRAQRVW